MGATKILRISGPVKDFVALHTVEHDLVECRLWLFHPHDCMTPVFLFGMSMKATIFGSVRSSRRWGFP